MIEPHYQDGRATLYAGDCLVVLAGLADASVDAVVCDPPYGLEFMGREWDSFKPANARLRTRQDARTNPAEGKSTTTVPEAYIAGQPFQAWCQLWATECLRVLKPGGHLLAFGGTRTYHRLAAGVEDAGFEIRDSITWLYGSGFPKSLDVSKAIDGAAGADRPVLGKMVAPAGNGQAGTVALGGAWQAEPDRTGPGSPEALTWSGWGTALKPASEPIVVARKPLAGTVAANVLAHGTGALNIDATRVPGVVQVGAGSVAAFHGGSDNYEPGQGRAYQDAGRWPANVVLSHHPDCALVCVLGCPVRALDEQTGTLTSGANPVRRGTDKFRDTYNQFPGQAECEPARGADSGGASRFFPVFRYEAKADTASRPRTPSQAAGDHRSGNNFAGGIRVCNQCANRTKPASWTGGDPRPWPACGHNDWVWGQPKPVSGFVAHPTVKPLDLMRWLVRLVTPPGGLVLDPFAGSGTTGEAARLEGMRCVLIEREPDYLPLIIQRLTKRTDPVAHLASKGEDLGLFGLLDEPAAGES